MRIVAVIEARSGTSSLPKRSFLPLAGATLFERMLERVEAALQLDEVVVATTSDAPDLPIRAVCFGRSVRCVVGNKHDMLDVYREAARLTDADAVVRLAEDCPLVDPCIIDRVVDAYRDAEEPYDYVSNVHPPSYPDGNDVEVLSCAALDVAWAEAKAADEREFVTPFIWRRPERFRIRNVAWETGIDRSTSYRLRVEDALDYELARRVYETLYVPGAYPFSLAQILEVVDEHGDSLVASRPASTLSRAASAKVEIESNARGARESENVSRA